MSRDLAQDSVDRALALCELGRLEDAEEALREALREEPEDPLAHGILALVLVDLDRAEEALRSASTTVALAPELSLGHVGRAQALLSLERFEDAEASANEAIRVDPEDSDPWVLLTAARLGQGRWDDAISAADRALSLEPESETAHGLRAVALSMSEGGADWEEAAGKTLAVAPGSALAHALSGQAHLVRGGEREAAERFREALRLDPESELAQAGLADAMKASHPLFRPFFRFFLWQERLSRGWRIAITVGPILLVKALRPAADNPFVIALIALWIAFVAVTWLSVPIANLALRFSPVGRAVLPADQKRSSAVFLVFVGAALLGVVLTITVSGGGFVLVAFACGLLAFSVGSAHSLSRRRRRIAYSVAVTAGIAAFDGGALIAAGVETAGAVIVVVASFSAAALTWVVRFG
jgi:cytochrome c-type biogenesis protein CcmH/NrfG